MLFISCLCCTTTIIRMPQCDSLLQLHLGCCVQLWEKLFVARDAEETGELPIPGSFYPPGFLGNGLVEGKLTTLGVGWREVLPHNLQTNLLVTEPLLWNERLALLFARLMATEEVCISVRFWYNERSRSELAVGLRFMFAFIPQQLEIIQRQQPSDSWYFYWDQLRCHTVARRLLCSMEVLIRLHDNENKRGKEDVELAGKANVCKA